MIKCYESSAIFDPIEGDGPEGFVDKGGCANLLTPSRAQQKGMDGMASNSSLVDFAAWTPPEQSVAFGQLSALAAESAA
jgi:trimethylamine-N-oxide reductase (cytochrome c)